MRTYFEVTAINCKTRYGKPPVFSDEQLSSLKMPVVFIGGKNDVLVNTKKSLEKLSQNVSDFKSLVLEGGHGLIGLDDRVFELLG